MRFLKKILLGFYFFVKERRIKINNTVLKYLLYKKKNSRILVVVFSAFNKERALYNYVRTLKYFKADRLYVKDDFSRNKKGSYYLGERGTFSVEKAVISLINGIKKPTQKCIFIGSSKGAYAALNFSCFFKNSVTIIGAPQYRLGTHLNKPYFKIMLEDILGEITNDRIETLDKRLYTNLSRYGANNISAVFLQYSNREEYFESQIAPLLFDLRALKIDVCIDCQNYLNHADVHKFFPPFLIKTLNEILNNV